MRPAFASRARQPSRVVSALSEANFQKALHPATTASTTKSRTVYRIPVRRRDCRLADWLIIRIQKPAECGVSAPLLLTGCMRSGRLLRERNSSSLSTPWSPPRHDEHALRSSQRRALGLRLRLADVAAGL